MVCPLLLGNTAQIKYDRMYNRVFDNSKLASVYREELNFMSINEGLRLCIKEYLCLSENQKTIMLNIWLELINLQGKQLR